MMHISTVGFLAALVLAFVSGYAICTIKHGG